MPVGVGPGAVLAIRPAKAARTAGAALEAVVVVHGFALARFDETSTALGASEALPAVCIGGHTAGLVRQNDAGPLRPTAFALAAVFLARRNTRARARTDAGGTKRHTTDAVVFLRRRAFEGGHRRAAASVLAQETHPAVCVSNHPAIST